MKLKLSFALFKNNRLKQLPCLLVSLNFDENCEVEFSFIVELGTKATDAVLWSDKNIIESRLLL